MSTESKAKRCKGVRYSIRFLLVLSYNIFLHFCFGFSIFFKIVAIHNYEIIINTMQNRLKSNKINVASQDKNTRSIKVMAKRIDHTWTQKIVVILLGNSSLSKKW